MVLVASACVAVGGITYTVAKFLFDRELAATVANHQVELSQFSLEQQQELASLSESYQSVKEQLEARLVSIERRLGGNDVFDVRNFFISDPNELSLSKYAEYHADAGFYAPTDESRWEYLRLSEIEFIEYILGQGNPILGMFSGIGAQTANDLPTVHVWKGIEEDVVESGTSPYRKLFPFISVERVSHDDVLGITGQVILDLTETLTTYERENFTDAEKEELSGFLTAFDKMYRGDSTGVMLSTTLMFTTMITNMFPGTKYYIRRLQKVDNVVYLQSITTLTDVRIDGVDYGAYFVTSENIMISTPEALYLVNTWVPSTEPIPRHQYFLWINEWLGDFAVLVK